MKDYEIVKEWNYKGFKCRVILNSSSTMQWYCGYVGLSRGHRFWGKGEEDIDVDVHGGLTFSSQGSNDDKGAERWQRIRWPDETIWWLGFDCAHGGDFTGLESESYEHRWTLEEVVKETNKLVRQLAKDE